MAKRQRFSEKVVFIDSIIEMMIKHDIFETTNAIIPRDLIKDGVTCRKILESMNLKQLVLTHYLVSSLSKIIDKVR